MALHGSTRQPTVVSGRRRTSSHRPNLRGARCSTTSPSRAAPSLRWAGMAPPCWQAVAQRRRPRWALAGTSRIRVTGRACSSRAILARAGRIQPSPPTSMSPQCSCYRRRPLSCRPSPRSTTGMTAACGSRPMVASHSIALSPSPSSTSRRSTVASSRRCCSPLPRGLVLRTPCSLRETVWCGGLWRPASRSPIASRSIQTSRSAMRSSSSRRSPSGRTTTPTLRACSSRALSLTLSQRRPARRRSARGFPCPTLRALTKTRCRRTGWRCSCTQLTIRCSLLQATPAPSRGASTGAAAFGWSRRGTTRWTARGRTLTAATTTGNQRVTTSSYSLMAAPSCARSPQLVVAGGDRCRATLAPWSSFRPHGTLTLGRGWEVRRIIPCSSRARTRMRRHVQSP
mmetsp:Transcript_10863/g.25235  ORF Transcript_10863/g.25235 Transcript_10863/m.25235 type:complete len:399 (-) Transcript_10863:1555-2751(-)